jgi:glycosyltransferase involved in cell wall biosynthesis
MYNDNKVIVVLPAYNAAKTLRKTVGDLPVFVDEVILVDDKSIDDTVQIGKELGLFVFRHESNKGYGGNQKTCYNTALGMGADIVVMLHPDYQYTPKLIHSMCFLISNDLYDVVLGSRILGKGALRGGMPIYKYILNRILTLVQNILMGQKLSEYHTGYRAFSAKVFENIDYMNNSEDFVFDNQLIAQLCFSKYRIGEISCPTKYEEDSCSINFRSSVIYGLGVLKTSFLYFISKTTGTKARIFRN